MLGILADENVTGLVESLVRQMQGPPWGELWAFLSLSLSRFEDVGLHQGASDEEVWRVCQSQQLLLITANRNRRGPDSLEATIRSLGAPESLPVFTVSDIDRLQTDRAYGTRLIWKLYDYLLDIDRFRGAGRLYLS